MSKEIQQLLGKLVLAILQTIKEGLSQEDWQPDYEQYFRWRLTEFEHGDEGITKKSAKGEHYLKPYWGRVAVKVHQQVSKLNVYNDILSLVSEEYPIEESESNYFRAEFLRTLVIRITTNVLEGRIKNPQDADKYTNSLIADLKGEKQEYRAEVQLKGIVIQSRSIKLDGDTRLRRPNRSDFEGGEPISIPTFVRRLEDPTAFLYTRIFTKADGVSSLFPSMELQNQIDRQVAVLRLFRVGAVQDIKTVNSTDSIIHIGGGTLTRGKLLGSDKYIIMRKDVKPLKRYWKNMEKAELPSSGYTSSQKNPDYLSIAYDRYNDSLAQGVIEKRISDAIMGLEALYLVETDELLYRLSMRVAKVLSLVSSKYHPDQVKNNLRDAYKKVRNKYVHGATLKIDERKKLEQKHGDLTQFTVTIIDYLRASIVALLGRPSKSSLIQKIDDSFLDREKESEISKIIFQPYDKSDLI